VKYLDAWSYCEWFNLLGFPAMVVPMGRSPEGLPIGVQIVRAAMGRKNACSRWHLCSRRRAASGHNLRWLRRELKP